MMKEARRHDLPTGDVPDYRTFVRHVWSYHDEVGGSALQAPPVMYRALFEPSDPDWLEIVGFTEAVTEANDLQERILVSETECEGDVLYELRFVDLQALHAFCVSLGDWATEGDDDLPVRVGEFIMWTLGFRWV